MILMINNLVIVHAQMLQTAQSNSLNSQAVEWVEKKSKLKLVLGNKCQTITEYQCLPVLTRQAVSSECNIYHQLPISLHA